MESWVSTLIFHVIVSSSLPIVAAWLPLYGLATWTIYTHKDQIYNVDVFTLFFTQTCTFEAFEGSMIYKSVYVLHFAVFLLYVHMNICMWTYFNMQMSLTFLRWVLLARGEECSRKKNNKLVVYHMKVPLCVSLIIALCLQRNVLLVNIHRMCSVHPFFLFICCSKLLQLCHYSCHHFGTLQISYHIHTSCKLTKSILIALNTPCLMYDSHLKQ